MRRYTASNKLSVCGRGKLFIMKISTNDALALLRLFDRADDKGVPRDITRMQISHPRAINMMAQFRHGRSMYAMLFDDTAEDNEQYILEQLAIVAPGVSADVLKNPSSDITTYGAPYKGKDVYFLELHTGTQRLDVYLAETYPDTSRSSWQKHIRQDRVYVNDIVINTPKYDVTIDDTIRVDLPDAPDHSDNSLPIIYIDDDIIVVDKPIGVLTHRKNPLDEEFTVADFFRRYTTHGLDTDRPGIVHRLDRDTSGVIVGARNELSYEHLKAQFANREVKKTYRAIVDGHLREDHCVIDLPIARNSAKPGSFVVDPNGKPAQTRLDVIDYADSLSSVELTPRTGRTHQLRVHLAHLGTPIHGDRLYGKPADRLYLHAYRLRCSGVDGAAHEFFAPVPDAFRQLMESSDG